MQPAKKLIVQQFGQPAKKGSVSALGGNALVTETSGFQLMIADGAD